MSIKDHYFSFVIRSNTTLKVEIKVWAVFKCCSVYLALIMLQEKGYVVKVSEESGVSDENLRGAKES
jgi:hypothetical protein